MKKIFSILLLLILCLTWNKPAIALDDDSRNVLIGINDRLIEFQGVEPVLKEGNTYIPLRLFSNEIEAEVIWNETTSTAYVLKNSKVLSINIETGQAWDERGEPVKLAFYIDQGRIYAPFRTISEFFKFKTSFIPEGPVARIASTSTMTDEDFTEKFKTEIEQFEARNDDNGKPVYLTFDDGPTFATKDILNVLEEYDAKATFFMLEPNIKNRKEIVKKVIAAGHNLGCHGVTHEKNQFYKSPQSALNEMKQCQKTIQKNFGVHTMVMRVPYGSKPFMTDPFQKVMKANNFKMWDWNVDSLDWKWNDAEKTVSYTIQQIKELEERGEVPIILLHDKKETAKALPRILDYLEEQGYTTQLLKNEMTAYNFWSPYKSFQSLLANNENKNKTYVAASIKK